MPWWTWSVSAIWSPMVMVGFNDVMGSWNTIPTRRPRMSLPSIFFSAMTSTPSSMAVPLVIRPGGIGINPMMLCTVTDLPQPDSPTMASVLPLSSEKDTPRTACTVPP